MTIIGVGRGDKVGLYLHNGYQTALLFLGAMIGGYVIAPLNLLSQRTQLAYVLDHCDCKILFTAREYEKQLSEALAEVRRPIGIIVIDLDDLKTINDTAGHPAGDAALRDLGERFRHVLRIGDDGARIGGDEFALILPNTPPEAVETLLGRVRNAEGTDRPSPSSALKYSGS